jgi:site-specific recombinase XerD
LTLRVKDVDLSRRVIVIRAGKGDRDRRTILPEVLVPSLGEYLMALRQKHLRDLAKGGGHYPLPAPLERRIPGAVSDWRGAWLFPARRDVWDRGRKRRVRFPMHATTIQRAIASAAQRARLNKRVTAHTFRHSFATQLLRSGYDIRTVQELLGHTDVSTTMIYLHVVQTGMGVRSPLDRFSAGPG